MTFENTIVSVDWWLRLMIWVPLICFLYFLFAPIIFCYIFQIKPRKMLMSMSFFAWDSLKVFLYLFIAAIVFFYNF